MQSITIDYLGRNADGGSIYVVLVDDKQKKRFLSPYSALQFANNLGRPYKMKVALSDLMVLVCCFEINQKIPDHVLKVWMGPKESN